MAFCISNPLASILVLVMGILLAVLAGWCIYLLLLIRRLRSQGEDAVSDEPGEMPRMEIREVHRRDRKSRELVGKLEEENLKALLDARLDDMEDEDGDVSKACATIELLDEIRILAPNYQGHDAMVLQKLVKLFQRQLAEIGAEVIDDDTWNPSRQKVGVIVRDLPAGSSPVISEKVASGLLIRGRVCRKQVVNLRMELKST